MLVIYTGIYVAKVMSDNEVVVVVVGRIVEVGCAVWSRVGGVWSWCEVE